MPNTAVHDINNPDIDQLSWHKCTALLLWYSLIGIQQLRTTVVTRNDSEALTVSRSSHSIDKTPEAMPWKTVWHIVWVPGHIVDEERIEA